MKNFKMLMLTAAVCLTAAPFFNSCSDMTDDSTPKDNSGIAGSYKLTAYNIPGSAIDFDGNGSSSNNLVTESDCFNSNVMKLNSDHTYMKVDNYIDLSSGTPACAEYSETGVWSRTGDVVTTTSSTVSGFEAYQLSYTYSKATGTLTESETDFAYPTIDSGNPTTSVGDVSFVFTKQ